MKTSGKPSIRAYIQWANLLVLSQADSCRWLRSTRCSNLSLCVLTPRFLNVVAQCYMGMPDVYLNVAVLAVSTLDSFMLVQFKGQEQSYT